MVDAALDSGLAQRRCVFEVTARRLPAGRRYGVVAGVERLLGAIEAFRFGDDELSFLSRTGVVSTTTLRHLADFRFRGDIWGYVDGEPYGPQCPLLVVEAAFGEAVLLETLILSVLNHDGAVAAAAARMVGASGGRTLIEMGSRRTHEAAAVDAAVAAYVCGFDATSNLAAGRRHGIPTRGTSAHAFTLVHDTEAAAFAAQIGALGVDTTLLVDTYDVHAAVALAIEVAGPGLGAVRLDSGDPAALSLRVREQLDGLGALATRIVVTGDLDEYALETLADYPVDAYGIGTSLVTGSGAPTAGLVYKLVARAGVANEGSGFDPVAKTSPGKTGRGGRKTVIRRYDQNGMAVADDVHVLNPDTPSAIGMAADPGGAGRGLLVPLIRAGERVWSSGPGTSRMHHARAMAELPGSGRDLSPGPVAVASEVVSLSQEAS